MIYVMMAGDIYKFLQTPRLTFVIT